MKKISWVQLCFTFVGVFLGAGFVSGQELWKFFACFGAAGLAGFLVSAVIMTAAMDNPLCSEILNARTYTTSATEQHPDGIIISNWFLRRIEDKDTTEKSSARRPAMWYSPATVL